MSRGNRSRSRKVNGTASPRLFCTASNAVATCRRRLRWRSAAITFPITNPISSRTARALPQRTAWMRPALRSIVC